MADTAGLDRDGEGAGLDESEEGCLAAAARSP